MKLTALLKQTQQVELPRCAVCGKGGVLYEVWQDGDSVFYCKRHMQYEPVPNFGKVTRYDDASFENFIVDAAQLQSMGYSEQEIRSIQLLHREAERFVKNVANGVRSNLTVFGYPGTGKSHMIYAVYHKLQSMGHSPYLMLWGVFIQSVYEWQKNGVGKGLTYYMDKIASASALLIDDLMYIPDTNFARHIAMSVIDRAYSTGAPIMLTTNYTEQELLSLIGEAAMDRLRERGVFLRLRHKSYRLQGGRK